MVIIAALTVNGFVEDGKIVVWGSDRVFHPESALSEGSVLLICGWDYIGTYNMCLGDLQILVSWTNDFNKPNIERGSFQRMTKFTCRHECLSLNNPVREGLWRVLFIPALQVPTSIMQCHCTGLHGAVAIGRVMDSSALGWGLVLEGPGCWLKSQDSMSPSPFCPSVIKVKTPHPNMICIMCAPDCSSALWEMN